ncbi:peptide ABC transporter substrate-binding protein [Salinithrix halophila]|uniref:Peptide ABC transporter substrate-binding protein n=1 Tax=Salinithrix halophila TaxID=1485204 RepID=A0ABV8JEH4_9BACL
MSKRWTSWIAIGLVLSMAFLAACGSDAGKGASDEQVLTAGMVVSEPPNLDPAKTEDSQSGLIARHVMEGLANMDKEGEPTPGIAEKWDVSKDGKKITFHLRDAKWSNGDPVTAGDFEYAWKRVLNPDTGSTYAYQLFYLKNGEKYNKGKAKADEVGVKAVDDKTLEVELEKPTPYFISLTSFYTLMPVNKKVVEKNKKWAANADTFVNNGAFNLAEWKHDSKIVLKKNKDYWNADKVKLAQINLPFIGEDKTGYQMFKAGEIDYGDKTIIPADMMGDLIKKGEVKSVPELASYAYEFNVKEKPFTNEKIRKAFAMAMDRKSIVENVAQGGQLPANGWVPRGMPDFAAEKDWVQAHDTYLKPTAQAEEAKKLLKEGMKEEGWDKLPPVTIDYNTDEGHKKIAEAIQQMWKKNLNVNVKLRNSEWKVYLEKKHTGDFQVARFGWLPDYVDPMTFLDMYTTDSGQNDPSYSNKKYDALIKKAKSTADQKVRMEALHKAEKILMEDMPIAPIYSYTHNTMQKENVKNVIYKKDGHTDFRFAYLTEE